MFRSVSVGKLLPKSRKCYQKSMMKHFLHAFSFISLSVLSEAWSDEFLPLPCVGEPTTKMQNHQHFNKRVAKNVAMLWMCMCVCVCRL